MDAFTEYTGLNGVIDKTNINNFASPSHIVNKIEKHVETNLKFIIVIKTTPNAFEIRSIYREIFGKSPLFSQGISLLKFYVGVRKSMDFDRLKDEMNTYGDLVMFNVYDDYLLLARKTVRILDYVTKYYNSDFVLMMDDDVYVNIHSIEKLVDSLDKNKYYYIGRPFCMDPIRNEGDPCYVSKTEYDGGYPEFMAAGCCILSSGLVRKVFEQDHVRYFRIDDVAIGMWVDEMEKKGTLVQRIHPESWNIQFDCQRGKECQGSCPDVVHPLRRNEIEWLYSAQGNEDKIDDHSYAEFVRSFPEAVGSSF